ncbi:MAG: hypothetical protein KA085_10975 [Phenylobacterium sp.]|uniref:hypothetical protein n=1 Tax=Phenylobacterium sp. TaxID=1871053 RepID=UPI001B79745D|nr:hypothetical protein [Phenylobacterium sp.]MBP7651164.1 hypothetical protein [Phenylobacterium sp.]MBP7816641.1 hypothetical protein [Phenylobacterium sp.]MBP9232322.1 hypothetical protein [Phenylobacterium sp.]MBP9756910.1 hypothetical protein [Phenylobacterium sp.]
MAQDPRSFSPAGPPQSHIDAEDIALNPEAEGLQEGIGHREGSLAEREHGKKTRAHAKDIISGRA